MLQTLKTKDNVSPRCNKAKTHRHCNQSIALCLQAKNYFEHQNSASKRILFCLINKEQFAATYRPEMYPPEI